MTVRDVILLTYPDAAVLAAGIVASWICVWFWATREHERSPWDLVLLLFCIAAGFALGWWVRGI